MINGTSVIDMKMLLKHSRVISVRGSKFAVAMHFGLREIVVNDNIIKATLPWECGRLSLSEDRADKRRLECVELTLLLVLTLQHCPHLAEAITYVSIMELSNFNNFSSAIKRNHVWNSRTTLSHCSSAALTRRQLRNYVYSPIKSVISSVWQSCCFQSVRIVLRG